MQFSQSFLDEIICRVFVFNNWLTTQIRPSIIIDTQYIYTIFFRIGGKPGVYTNVVAHLDWIREMIKDTSNDYEEENVSDTEVSDNDGQFNELSKTSSESEENLKSSGTGIKCLASNGKLCKFPFKFRGKVR